MSAKLKRTLALALAGGSLAIGVPAALAAGGGDAGSAGGGAANQTAPFVQDEGRQDRARPDRGDCPEKDGGGAQQESSTEAPSI
jgi:hypothetical protein